MALHIYLGHNGDIEHRSKKTILFLSQKFCTLRVLSFFPSLYAKILISIFFLF